MLILLDRKLTERGRRELTALSHFEDALLPVTGFAVYIGG
jgi:hypothetical protein